MRYAGIHRSGIMVLSLLALTAAACGESKGSSQSAARSTVSVSATASSAGYTVPCTIEAEAMSTKTVGGAYDTGWMIWSNGYVEDSATFTSSGNFRFDITASGSPEGGVWPTLELRIDQ